MVTTHVNGAALVAATEAVSSYEWKEVLPSWVLADTEQPIVSPVGNTDFFVMVSVTLNVPPQVVTVHTAVAVIAFSSGANMTGLNVPVLGSRYPGTPGLPPAF